MGVRISPEAPVTNISKGMNTIQIGNLPIDIHDGAIGISMSGGADSSILFYILMKYAPGPINVFSCGNGRTNNQEVEGAVRVINYVMKKIERYDVTFHAHWEKHKLVHNTFNEDMIRKVNVSIMYAGFTTPPPDGAIEGFDVEACYGGKYEPGVTYPNYVRDGKIYMPFANIDKRGIAGLYKELDVKDLYSVTRSCESLTLLGGHCGKCWWCKERVWAFGKLQ
jgi:7-cyano-7-deazaguanine synthase in queuosine biosynthesis